MCVHIYVYISKLKSKIITIPCIEACCMRKVPSKIWIFVATALPVMMCSLAALVLRGNCHGRGSFNGWEIMEWSTLSLSLSLFSRFSWTFISRICVRWWRIYPEWDELAVLIHNIKEWPTVPFNWKILKRMLQSNFEALLCFDMFCILPTNQEYI